MTDDEVKALAEKLSKIYIVVEYDNGNGVHTQGGGLEIKSAEALARVALEFCEERSEATELAIAIFRKQDKLRAKMGLSWPDGPDGIYIGEVTPGVSTRLVVRDGRDTCGEYATGMTVEDALARYLDCCLEFEEEPK